MPKTQVVFYREVDGAVPVLEWFDGLAGQGAGQVHSQNPEAIRNGARTAASGSRPSSRRHLRIASAVGHVNYRILYFFHGRIAAILAHGLTKEDRVPSADIDMAFVRKQRYEQASKIHTFEE